jgi:hypothetical protein
LSGGNLAYLFVFFTFTAITENGLVEGEGQGGVA